MLIHPEYKKLILENRVKVVGFATPKIIRKVDYEILKNNVENIHSNCLQIINIHDPVPTIPPNSWISKYRNDNGIDQKTVIGTVVGAASGIAMSTPTGVLLTGLNPPVWLAVGAATCAGTLIAQNCSYYMTEKNENSFKNM